MVHYSMKQRAAVEKLLAWMAEKDWKKARLARAMGISATAVNAWRSGKAAPDPVLRGFVRTLTGIPESDWETDTERAMAEKAREGLAKELRRAG